MSISQDQILYEKATKNFKSTWKRKYKTQPHEMFVSFGSFSYFLKYKKVSLPAKSGYKDWFDFFNTHRNILPLSYHDNISRVKKSIMIGINQEFKNFMFNTEIEKIVNSKSGYYYFLHESIMSLNYTWSKTSFNGILSMEDFISDFKSENRIRKNSKRYNELIRIVKPLLFVSQNEQMKEEIKNWNNKLNSIIEYDKKEINNLIYLRNNANIYSVLCKSLNNNELSSKFKKISTQITKAINLHKKEINKNKTLIKNMRLQIKKRDAKISLMQTEINRSKKALKELK